jgi:hypothetical protein
MAKSVYTTASTRIQEPGAANYINRIEYTDESGSRVASFNDRKDVPLLAAASGVNCFPTGAGTLANGNLQTKVVPLYDAQTPLTDRYITFTADGVAIVVRDEGAFGIDTSLTVANGSASYPVTVQLQFYVRTA